MAEESKPQEKRKMKILDEFAAVNSLFSAAVFVGLSFPPPTQTSLEIRPQCIVPPGTNKTIVFLEVLSFACFLLSSMVAKSIRMRMVVTEFEANTTEEAKTVVFLLMALASLFGFVFLNISLALVIVVKLGKPACETISFASVAAIFVFALIILIIHWKTVRDAMKHFVEFKD